ncbi:unnamed protein product [Brachionus calyciflorus]|uniref:C2H2-type domain-containing protein n=1 Tax=Brachionus calyciflorus TaxID=104777 RepID=A0A813QJW7_9BILA|nr:unnamed protein product [Brachionus calyciflorus]
MTENEEGFDTYKCSFHDCRESFSKRLDLHRHLFYVHKKFEPECPICQKKFTSYKNMRMHEKTHGDYQCPVCEQKFNEKHYLKAHLLTHEEKRQRFKCDLCEKSFLYRGNLAVHNRTKHKNDKYKCLICDRALSSKQKLDEHMVKKHKLNEKELVINIKDLEDISTDEDLENEGYVECVVDNDDSEYGQTLQKIKSNFYLKKQDSCISTQNSYSLSKEDFDILLNEDVFYY